MRSESSQENERPRRKDPISKNSRSERNRDSTGYDGAMSTEDNEHVRLMDSNKEDEDSDGRWSGAFEKVFGKEAGKPHDASNSGGGARE